MKKSYSFGVLCGIIAFSIIIVCSFWDYFSPNKHSLIFGNYHAIGMVPFFIHFQNIKKTSVLVNVLIPLSLALTIATRFQYIIYYINYGFPVVITYILNIFSIIYLSLMVYTEKNGRFAIIKKLWFIPALLEYTSVLIAVIPGDTIFTGISDRIFEVLYSIGIGFTGLSLSQSDALKIEKTIKTNSANYRSEYGYCDMAKHVLLLLFTFGIYQYIWIYKTTSYLNNSDEEYRNPTSKLLLCMFVPFYYIYWIYQSAKRIDISSRKKGIESDITSISVILAIFVGIVAPIVMQSKINTICTYKGKAALAQEIKSNSDKTEEIRNYKKLLDDGIITEEEFESKKKQLLEV